MSYSEKNQSVKVEELYFGLQDWKSNLHFIRVETVFIDRLLKSYVFQPNTQKLFEHLEDYQQRLLKTKKYKKILKKRIAEHGSSLGGMIECTDQYCDLQYAQKHDALKEEVFAYIKNYSALKSEIFTYAGSILKKRKHEPREL